MNAPLMIGEAFPANDVLARWVMVLSIARNDLALATERIVRANEDDDGTNMHWQRLLSRSLLRGRGRGTSEWLYATAARAAAIG
jgi:hypothetical protein